MENLETEQTNLFEQSLQNNVSLQNEFLAVMPTVRAFEANRQVFIMQNTNIQKAISQLGSAS